MFDLYKQKGEFLEVNQVRLRRGANNKQCFYIRLKNHKWKVLALFFESSYVSFEFQDNLEYYKTAFRTKQSLQIEKLLKRFDKEAFEFLDRFLAHLENEDLSKNALEFSKDIIFANSWYRVCFFLEQGRVDGILKAKLLKTIKEYKL